MNRDGIEQLMKKRKLDTLVVCGEANLQALIGFSCDNGILVVSKKASCRNSSLFTLTSSFFTDFRYAPEARRKCRGIKVVDIKRLDFSGKRIGYEGFIPHSRYLQFEKFSPKAKFVDVAKNLLEIRAVKSSDEIAKLRAAEKLDCDIYEAAVKKFRPGMTERRMAAIIKTMMIERGEGEAFETIVCVGKNAAECHHVPDDTVWNGRESVLVDMGVKLNGYCSDMTRNLLPKRPSATYRRVYELVLEANRRAREAVRPGLTAGALDAVARDFLSENGFGAAFGHSLGHGVGLEIHEPPYAAKKNLTPLEPGMIVTIEPGVYLEGNLGVRIEDLVLVTETGYELLSKSEKAHF